MQGRMWYSPPSPLDRCLADRPVADMYSKFPIILQEKEYFLEELVWGNTSAPFTCDLSRFVMTHTKSQDGFVFMDGTEARNDELSRAVRDLIVAKGK